MRRRDDGLSKSLQPFQNLFETRGSGGTCRVSMRIWSAGPGSSMDRQSFPHQVNETNCIEQSLVCRTYQVSLRICSAGSGSLADQQGILILGQRDFRQNDQAMLKDGLVWLSGLARVD